MRCKCPSDAAFQLTALRVADDGEKIRLPAYIAYVVQIDNGPSPYGKGIAFVWTYHHDHRSPKAVAIAFKSHFLRQPFRAHAWNWTGVQHNGISGWRGKSSGLVSPV